MHIFIIFFLFMPLSFLGMETPSNSLAEIMLSRNKSLIQMATEGNLPCVKLLCNIGADPNFIDEEIGTSALLAAINKDNEEIVHYLVDEKNANVKRRMWSTCPMDIALEKGNEKIITILDNKNAEIRGTLNSNLQSALNSNKHASIRYLLMKKKADVNETAAEQITPLHWAAKNGDQKLAQFLLANNANKEAVDEFGRTPLFEAAYKHPDIAKSLIENGANINYCTQAHQNHCTPLFYAVWGLNHDLVTYMINKKAQINIIDSHNKTPLYYAAEVGNEPMVRVLLENGAKPDLMHTRSAGYTPLAIAAKKNHVEIIKLMIARGANVNMHDSYGDTALLHARAAGATKAFDTLKLAGANIKSAKNIQGIITLNLNPEIEKIVNQTAFQRLSERWSNWFFSNKRRVNAAIFFANIKNSIAYGWRHNFISNWFKK